MKILRIVLVCFALTLSGEALVPQPASAASNIIVLVASWCPYCKIVTRMLDMKGVSYTAYDVEHDSEGIKRYQSMGGNGVPIIIAGRKMIRGFNLDAIREIISEESEVKEEDSSPLRTQL